MFRKIGPWCSLSVGSCPYNCGRGFLPTHLHVTQLHIMERIILWFPMTWNHLDNDAVTSVVPGCRSLRCSLWMRKTRKGCLPGRITGWRLAHFSNDRFNLPPTRNILFTFTNVQSGRSLLLRSNCLIFCNVFSFSEYSVIFTAANQWTFGHLHCCAPTNIQSSALLWTNVLRLRLIPYILKDHLFLTLCWLNCY